MESEKVYRAGISSYGDATHCSRSSGYKTLEEAKEAYEFYKELVDNQQGGKHHLKIVAFVKDDEIYAILSGKRKAVAKIWYGLEKYHYVYKWASEECKICEEPIDVEWRNSKP